MEGTVENRERIFISASTSIDCPLPAGVERWSERASSLGLSRKNSPSEHSPFAGARKPGDDEAEPLWRHANIVIGKDDDLVGRHFNRGVSLSSESLDRR